MDKFLERYGIPRLNQEEIENMNRSITNTEIETVITKFTISKSPRCDDFTGKFYQTFQRRANIYPSEAVQKITEEGTLPNSFYKATIEKPDKDTTKKKKENYRPISLMNIEHRCKNPQQNTSSPNPTTH